MKTRMVNTAAATSSFSSSLGTNNHTDVVSLPLPFIRPQQQLSPQFRRGALSMSLSELSIHLGGYGRAQLTWDCYQRGMDPTIYFRPTQKDDTTTTTTTHTPTTVSSSVQQHQLPPEEEEEEVVLKLPGSRRTQRLGRVALERLEQLYSDYYDHDDSIAPLPPFQGSSSSSNSSRHPVLQSPRPWGTTGSGGGGGSLEGGVATLTYVTQSPTDGTTKMVLTLCDGQQIETVIIPFHPSLSPTSSSSQPKQSPPRSTLCISSQVGCQQACTFCATGTMGKIRSLTTDEILVQMFYGRKLCNPQLYPHLQLPPITNVGTYVCIYMFRWLSLLFWGVCCT
jgi:hypothetical protein